MINQKNQYTPKKSIFTKKINNLINLLKVILEVTESSRYGLRQLFWLTKALLAKPMRLVINEHKGIR